MDKIIRIDVGAPGGPAATEEPMGKYVGFGGRAITSAIVHDEVPPLCHALSGENKLVIAPGLMAGTTTRMSCRLSVGCKSPLTGAITKSNAGGQAVQHLGKLGVAGIVIQGTPATKDLYKITISQKGVEIEEVNRFSGLTNHGLCAELEKDLGPGSSVISIGPAGERKMSNSTIAVTDSNLRPTCHAWQGGVGAVMGAKQIKCIVIDSSGTEPREPEDSVRFQNANQKFIEGLHRHDFSGRKLPTNANILTKVLNGAGGCPAFNARTVGLLDKSTHYPKIEPAAPAFCHLACSINCTGEYLDKDGNYLFKAPSYEAFWAFGRHCGISDMQAIAELGFQVEDYGFDCIEMGMAIRNAMNAGIIEFGDAKGTMRLVKEAGEATPLGRIIGNGAETTARCFGTPTSVPAESADEERDEQLINRLGTLCARQSDNTPEAEDAAEMMAAQVDITRNMEIATAALDSIGLCLFSVFAILDQPETLNAIVEIINAMFDIRLTSGDIVGLGKSVLTMECDFNRRAGVTKLHDRLPLSFSREFLESHKAAFEAFNKVKFFTG